MQKYGRFGGTPVLQTRPRVEDAAPQNSLPRLYRPGYGARKTRREAIERNVNPTTRRTTHQKRSAYRRYGGGGKTEKALRQANYRKVTMARQTLVEVKENASAITREKSCQKPPADHWHDGGLDEETTNTRNGR